MVCEMQGSKVSLLVLDANLIGGREEGRREEGTLKAERKTYDPRAGTSGYKAKISVKMVEFGAIGSANWMNKPI